MKRTAAVGVRSLSATLGTGGYGRSTDETMKTVMMGARDGVPV
jgi:hypothetical protein